MSIENQKTCKVCARIFDRPIDYYKGRPMGLRNIKYWRTQVYCSKKCMFLCSAYREKMKAIALSKGYGKWCKGKTLSDDHKKNISTGLTGLSRTGQIWSAEARIKSARNAKRGAESHLWRGGITGPNHQIRSSAPYRLWRDLVFRRDEYTCQMCAKIGGRIQADHIKPFSLFQDLRFDVNNGRTLCIECHKKTPTYLVGRKRLESLFNMTITEVEK